MNKNIKILALYEIISIIVCGIIGLCILVDIQNDEVCFDMRNIGSQINETVYYEDMYSGIISIDRYPDGKYYEFLVKTNSGYTWDIITENNGSKVTFCSRTLSNKTQEWKDGFN